MTKSRSDIIQKPNLLSGAIRTKLISSQLATFFNCLAGFITGANLATHEKRLKELRKLKFYLNNKEKIEASLKLIKQNNNLKAIFKGNDIPEINVNTIDNYKLRYLRQLKKLVEQENNRIYKSEENTKKALKM